MTSEGAHEESTLIERRSAVPLYQQLLGILRE